MPYRRRGGLSPLTTWHSQTGLLLISATWGLSYMMPLNYRISFSEVFPPNIANSVLPKMWVWGLILLASAVIALASEQLALRVRSGLKWLWGTIFGCHIILAALYFGLAVAALFSGFNEIPGGAYPHPPFWAGAISAISRPVLWSYIGYLHTTYARLPRPGGERPTSGRHRQGDDEDEDPGDVV